VSTHEQKAQPRISFLNDYASATRELAIIRRYGSTLEKRHLGTHMRAIMMKSIKSRV